MERSRENTKVTLGLEKSFFLMYTQCPYYLKSLWRYADGDLNALVYDTTLKAACMSDPCSLAQCGHQVSFAYFISLP